MSIEEPQHLRGSSRAQNKNPKIEIEEEKKKNIESSVEGEC